MRFPHLLPALLPLLGALCCTLSAAEQNKPLRVYILAGQSNMEGHARVETFDYLSDDPATTDLLKKMRGPDGKPAVCKNVWVSYFTGGSDENGEGTGLLTAGYGARRRPVQDGGKIGPEFTFGLTLEERLDQPVLLIKTAWGGKSLHTDFRPPGAGPYRLNEYQRKLYHGPPGHGIPKDVDRWLAEKERDTGHYYRLMLGHIQRVLADPGRVCPRYRPENGIELAGFVWLQGWNDLVDSHTYPASGKPGRFALYSELLGTLIRDLRHDLHAPRLPFVIGVLGIGGTNAPPDTLEFRRAMAAPALLPEFRGNVFAVQTAPFWAEELGVIDKKRDTVRQMAFYLESKHRDHANSNGTMTPDQKRAYLTKFESDLISPAEAALWTRGASNAGYHYLGCAKTFALMGRAFAEALLQNPESGTHP